MIQAGSVGLALAFIAADAEITLNVGGNMNTSGFAAGNSIISSTSNVNISAQGSAFLKGSTIASVAGTLSLSVLGDLSLINRVHFQ